jgi:hypothetical protein
MDQKTKEAVSIVSQALESLTANAATHRALAAAWLHVQSLIEPPAPPAPARPDR